MAKKKKTVVTPKRIMNSATGFNIMVNLYILRYLYIHLKKHSDMKDAKYFYTDILEISRQRFQRICRGEAFQISVAERTRLSELFAIDPEYFNSKGSIIQVLDLTVDDWKCFFNTKYSVGYDIKIIMKPGEKKEEVQKRESTERCDRVLNALKTVTTNRYIAEKCYDIDPLYRVHYYYYYHETYGARSDLIALQLMLEQVYPSEWSVYSSDLDGVERLKVVRDRLKEHLEYIEAVLVVSKYRK